MRTSTNSTLAVSPDGKWVVVVSDPTDEMVGGVMLYPVGGGLPTLVCRSCAAATMLSVTSNGAVPNLRL